MDERAILARLFRQLAALLDEEGVDFKPAAYRRAAQVIEDYSGNFGELTEKKDLMKLSGIGQATAEKILEFRKTGKVAALQELLAKHGGISDELLMIENLGAKRILKLQKALGIHSKADLVAAAKEGRIRSVPGFSEVMEKKILASALESEQRNKRYALSEIADDVEALLKALRKVPGVDRAEAAGSYRRKKATVGDIDVLIITKKPQAVHDAIINLPFVRNVVASGDTKLSFTMQSGIRTDLRFVRKDQWGSALLYFTGNKEHNIALRKLAIKRGWKLNEYGLFDAKENVIASREERDIYDALELPYYEPWEREEGNN